MNSFWFLLLFFILTIKCYGQSIVWEKKFDEGQIHMVINKTVDSSFIVSGASIITTNYPAHILKYDWNGNIVWQKAGGLLWSGEQDIKQTIDKGYIFSGSIRNSSNPDISDIFLQKYTTTGDTLWKKKYNTPVGADWPTQVLVRANGSILTFGMTTDGMFSYYSLRKTDSLGNTVWFNKYAESDGCYSSSMVFNRYGNMILSGSSTIASSPIRFHPFLMEVDQNGDTIRTKKIIVRSVNDQEFIGRFFNNIIQTTDGGYAFSGYIDSSSFRTGFIVKTDSSFNKQWVFLQPHLVNKSQYTSKIAEFSDSTYVLLSNQESPSTNHIIITKVSKTGQLINKHILNANWCSKIRLYDWEFLPDSSVVVVGGCLDTPHKAYMARIGRVGIPAVVEPIPTDTIGPIGTAYEPLINQQATLGNSYPNPAKAEAVIPYTLPKDVASARIEV